MPIKFLSQILTPQINTEGNQSVNGSNFRHAYATQPKTDVYAQHDNKLLHGFGGEQYNNGKKIGGLLNYEA